MSIETEKGGGTKEEQLRSLVDELQLTATNRQSKKIRMQSLAIASTYLSRCPSTVNSS